MDAFDKIFRESVRRQTDVDVDFAIFLSGGLDSSLVSAVTRSLHPQGRLKAYTLRFEEESFDEGDFAESVATSLKLEPVTVWVRPDDLPGRLSHLIKTGGEPLADPAWLPAALLARRTAEDVPMALVGREVRTNFLVAIQHTSVRVSRNGLPTSLHGSGPSSGVALRPCPSARKK